MAVSDGVRPASQVVKKAAFIDKDGTLIDDVPYNIDPQRITLTERACDGLRLLQEAGYLLIVVTNQGGIARGMFDRAALQGVEQHLRTLLADSGVQLDGFYYCPHDVRGTVPAYAVDCTCRKPQAGMLLQAAADHAIDLSSSWMIGDILNDVEAGKRAGCRTVLIDNGNETEWQLSSLRTPDLVTSNLYHAACRINETERINDVLQRADSARAETEQPIEAARS